MDKPSGKPLCYFTPDEVSDILGRAIRLEQVRSEGLSVAELEHAASEVGISQSALHQAIEQYRSQPISSQVAVAHLPRLVMHGAVGGAAISLLIGALAPMLGSVRPLETAPLSVFLSIMLSGGLAGIRSKGGAKLGFLEFQARNLGVFLGLTFGIVSMSGFYSGHPDAGTLRWITIAVGITLWGATSAVGGAVAAWRSRQQESQGTGPTPSERWTDGLKRGLAARLREWSDWLARRVVVRALNDLRRT